MPDVGVTLYVAVAEPAVVLVRLPVRYDKPDAGAPPLNPVPEGAAHEYVMPAGTIVPVGVYEKATLPQETVLCAGKTGVGLTDTVSVNAAPLQVFDVGVTL